jgi:hypothetical protein
MQTIAAKTPRMNGESLMATSRLGPPLETPRTFALFPGQARRIAVNIAMPQLLRKSDQGRFGQLLNKIGDRSDRVESVLR